MASEVAKNLRDRRLSAWEQAKAALENAENRSQADVDRIYDSAMAEVDALDARLKTVLDSEARSRETDAAYDNVSAREQAKADPTTNAREAELRSFLQSEPGESGYKRAIELQRVSNSQLNLRTLGSASAANTTGSNTVPTDFYDQLIAYLIEVSGILQTGPTVLRTQGGEQINIPTVASHPTASGGIAQAQTLPNAEPTFSQITLGAQKYGVLVPVARELIDDTAVDLLGYLAMSAGRAIGNAFGSALINGGTVTGGLVPSITNFVTGAAASGTNGVVAGGPTYSNLIDLEYSVIAPYRQSRNTYWLAKDQTIGSLRKLTDSNGRPLWEPSPQPGTPDMLLGKPLVADPFMPAVAATTAAKSIVFGDFSQYFVRLVGGLRFERSDDFQFGSDVVTFRAVLRGDGNLADKNALSALKGQ